MAIIGSSAAGSACERLPPMVPRLRIARCATWRIAADITCSLVAISGECSISRCRVSAPIATRSPRNSMNESSLMPLRSTSTVGCAIRKFSSGNRLWPPARIFPWPLASASASTAASSVVGATYSNLAGFIDYALQGRFLPSWPLLFAAKARWPFFREGPSALPEILAIRGGIDQPLSGRQIERAGPHRETVQHELCTRYRKRRVGRQALDKLLGRDSRIVVDLVDQSHRSRLLGGVAVARVQDTL